MSVSKAHAATSSRLRSMGGQTIPEYLAKAFPEADTTPVAPVAPVAPLVPVVPVVPDVPAAPGVRVEADADLVSTALTRTRAEMDGVPFYIKRRGKGKGKPVMFNWSHSSVAQLYELAAQMGLPEPVFSHTRSGASHFPMFDVTVEFNQQTATNDGDFAGSLKEGKEQACKQLVRRILAHNATTLV